MSTRGSCRRRPRSSRRCCRWSSRRCALLAVWFGWSGWQLHQRWRRRRMAIAQLRDDAVEAAQQRADRRAEAADRAPRGAGAAGRAGRRRPGGGIQAARPGLGRARSDVAILRTGPERRVRRAAQGRLRPPGRDRGRHRRRQAGRRAGPPGRRRRSWRWPRRRAMATQMVGVAYVRLPLQKRQRRARAGARSPTTATWPCARAASARSNAATPPWPEAPKRWRPRSRAATCASPRPCRTWPAARSGSRRCRCFVRRRRLRAAGVAGLARRRTSSWPAASRAERPRKVAVQTLAESMEQTPRRPRDRRP